MVEDFDVTDIVALKADNASWEYPTTGFPTFLV